MLLTDLPFEFLALTWGQKVLMMAKDLRNNERTSFKSYYIRERITDYYKNTSGKYSGLITLGFILV